MTLDASQFAQMSAEEIITLVGQGIGPGQPEAANLEMTRRLIASNDALAAASDKSARSLIGLTKVLVVLTAVLVVLTIVLLVQA